MGWWETGNGDDIIGDGPADTITTALRVAAQKREAEQRPKPTLSEMLDAVAGALRGRRGDLLAGGDGLSLRRLAARADPGRRVVTGGDRGEPAPDAFAVEAFGEAIEEIAAEYEDSALERPPRLSELLASLRFVLSYQPDEYLSIEEDASVQAIWAETAR